MSKLQVLRELWEFMRENRKYWMIPIITVLVLVGILLVVTQSSVVAPFIYAFF